MYSITKCKFNSKLEAIASETRDLNMASRERWHTFTEVMEAIFLNSDSERDENNSNSDSESGGSDEDVASETGNEAQCTESSNEIESEMKLSADEENLPRRRRNPRAAAHGAEIQWKIYEDIDPFESTWLPKFTQRPGIHVDAIEFSPVDVFYLFLPR